MPWHVKYRKITNAPQLVQVSKAVTKEKSNKGVSWRKNVQDPWKACTKDILLALDRGKVGLTGELEELTMAPFCDPDDSNTNSLGRPPPRGEERGEGHDFRCCWTAVMDGPATKQSCSLLELCSSHNAILSAHFNVRLTSAKFDQNKAKRFAQTTAFRSYHCFS